MTSSRRRHPRTGRSRCARRRSRRGSPRARRHLRIIRSDRYRPRGRPPCGGTRRPPPGSAYPGRPRRARLGPSGRAHRRGHVRRRGRGGGARRRPHRRPAVERGPQAADPRQPQRAHRGARRRGRRARRSDLPVGVGASATTATPATASSTRARPSGAGFLAEVCRDWEAATQKAVDAGVRVVNLRTGLVLAPAGGLLGVLRPLFKFVPRRAARAGHPVHAVDLARRRGRRHPARAGTRQRRRPGQPHRADARHQRRVHEGARRGACTGRRPCPSRPS